MLVETVLWHPCLLPIFALYGTLWAWLKSHLWNFSSQIFLTTGCLSNRIGGIWVALFWLLKLCIEIANWLFFQLLQCIAPGMFFSFLVKFCQMCEVMNYYFIPFDGIIILLLHRFDKLSPGMEKNTPKATPVQTQKLWIFHDSIRDGLTLPPALHI